MDPTVIATLLPCDSNLPISLILDRDGQILFPRLTPRIALAQLHPIIEALLHILNGDLTSAHFLARKWHGVVPIRLYDVCSVNGEAELSLDKARLPPKVEGMLLHAILHRLEGDYENARAWYQDVDGKVNEHWRRLNGTDRELDSGGSKPLHESLEAHHQDVWAHVHPRGLESIHWFLDTLRSWRKKHEPAYARSHVVSDTLTAAHHSDVRRQQDGEYQHAHDDCLDQQTDSRNDEMAQLWQWHENELRKTWQWCTRRYGVEKWEQADGEFVDKADEKYQAMGQGQVVGGEGWRKF